MKPGRALAIAAMCLYVLASALQLLAFVARRREEYWKAGWRITCAKPDGDQLRYAFDREEAWGTIAWAARAAVGRVALAGMSLSAGVTGLVVRGDLS